MRIDVMVLIFCVNFSILPLNVSSAELCYYCLERCDRYRFIENCTYRYGNNKNLKCVSIQADSESLVRKQCMSHSQAIDFCQKFNYYESVRCYWCNEDLCNSGNASYFFSIFTILFYVAVVNNI